MRTHKENLKHLREQLERKGCRVVRVSLIRSRRIYCATTVNFVEGGHIFDWTAGTDHVSVCREENGKYVFVKNISIEE